MSHEITVREDGVAEAAFALQPAWHGLGGLLRGDRAYRPPATTRRLAGAAGGSPVQRVPLRRRPGPEAAGV